MTMLTWNMCKYFSDSDKYFSATHPAHNLRVLEDLLLDHGEAALHEGSVSSRVPRHAFILVHGLGAAGLGHVDADEDEVPGLLVVVVPALEPRVVGHPVAGRAHAAAAHVSLHGVPGGLD